MSLFCECYVLSWVSATGQQLVQRSLIECIVSECDSETSRVSRCRPTRTVEPWKRKVGSGSDLTDYLCIVGSRAGSRPSRCIFNCSSMVARIEKKKKIPYILESNPHPNLIRTHFCRFLKQKKSYFAVLIRTFPSTAPCAQLLQKSRGGCRLHGKPSRRAISSDLSRSVA
jgi:hypothetical protein